jgi:hypothetical protein
MTGENEYWKKSKETKTEPRNKQSKYKWNTKIQKKKIRMKKLNEKKVRKWLNH